MNAPSLTIDESIELPAIDAVTFSLMYTLNIVGCGCNVYDLDSKKEEGHTISWNCLGVESIHQKRPFVITMTTATTHTIQTIRSSVALPRARPKWSP